MDRFRLTFTTVTIIIALTSGYFIYNKAHSSGAITNADKLLSAEISVLNNDIKKLEERCDAHSASIEKNNSIKFQNEDESKELAALNEQIEIYTKKQEELEKQLNTAKSKKSRLSQHEDEVKKLPNYIDGETVALNSGAYVCTSQVTEITLAEASDSSATSATSDAKGKIPPGRYKISGTGSFRVVSELSNAVTESQNLKALDSNSYILNLSEHSELITDGEVSVTLKKQE